MTNGVRIITAVDVYGDYDEDSRVLREDYILMYGNGPDEHIVAGDLAGKMRRLKQLEEQALSSNMDDIEV